MFVENVLWKLPPDTCMSHVPSILSSNKYMYIEIDLIIKTTSVHAVLGQCFPSRGCPKFKGFSAYILAHDHKTFSPWAR